MPVVCVVEIGRRYMVSAIPVCVNQLAIVGVVHDHLVLGYLKSTPVFILSICKLKDLLGSLASKGRLSLLCCDRWPHVRINHGVVPRHLQMKVSI